MTDSTYSETRLIECPSISYHLKIISLPLVPQTDTFEIGNHDGKITLNGPLDFENEQRYTLFVTAKVSRRML